MGLARPKIDPCNNATIIEEAPSEEDSEVAQRQENETQPFSPRLFPLSARSAVSLRNNCQKLANWISVHPDASLSSLGYTLAHRRDHLSKRAGVVASSQDELAALLIKAAKEDEDPNIVVGEVQPGAERGPVWVFSGHGAQWEGMAKELIANNKVFADCIDSMNDIFKSELGYSAREAILESTWDTVERVQAMTFAIQVGLSAVWRSLGLEPSAVIGHSVGEVAAAVISGALDLREAALFACKRAAIYQRLAGNGAMAMVRLPFEEAEKKLAGNQRVVAAIAASSNGTVISGDTDELDRVIANWKKDRVIARKVGTIDAAFHSPQIDPLLDDIRSAAAHITMKVPHTRLYTTTLKDPRSIQDCGPDFWATNSRGAVLLTNAVGAAIEDGFSLFLEVSTSPIVAPSIRETVDASGRDDIGVFATLMPKKGEMNSILSSLASLYSLGCPISWPHMFPAGELLQIPTQAWNHKAFWPSLSTNNAGRGSGHSPSSHTLLGQPEQIRSTPPITVWRTQLEYSTRPYPGTHPLFGVEIVPAAALLFSLMKAGGNNRKLAELVDIDLHTPVPVDNPLELQIVQQGEVLSISSRREDVDKDSVWSWTTHTVSHIQDVEDEHLPTRPDASIMENCTERWSWEKVEELYQRRGIGGYGFPWKMLDLHRSNNAITASFTLASDEGGGDEQRAWAEILDAALTICPLLLPDDELLRMPSHIDRVFVNGAPPKDYLVLVVRDGVGETEDDCLLTALVVDADGKVVATMEGVLFGVLDGARSITSQPTDIVFTEDWEEAEDQTQTTARPSNLIFVGDRFTAPAFVVEALESLGAQFDFVASAEELEPSDGMTVIVLGTGLRRSESIDDAAARNAWTLIATAQRLISPRFSSANPTLLCLTKGVRSAATDDGLVQSPMLGIGRIIAGERPDLWAGLYDLDTDVQTLEIGTSLFQRMLRSSDEDIISIQDGKFWALRLVPARSQAEYNRSDEQTGFSGCRANAAYLVTGGMGALGLEAARYLAGRGARRIVLAGRSGLPSRSEWRDVTDPRQRSVIHEIEEIEESGVSIIPLKVDVGNLKALETELSNLERALPPIKGVVHSAGVFVGGMLGEIDREALETSFAAKVRGAANLHTLFPRGTLDFFVQFSSSGQLGRLTGQTCYAAANSFLDSLAKHRNSSGSKDSISIGWMAWRGVGMSKSIDATMVEARGRGLDAIEPTAGLKAWRFCEDIEHPYAAVFTPVIDAGGAEIPLFRNLVPEPSEDSASTSNTVEIPTENRLAWLVSDIRRLVAIELKADEESLEVKRPLVDMGVDSLMTVSLRVRLRKRYGFEFPPTLLWNSPSVHAIAQFVEKELANEPELELT